MRLHRLRLSAFGPFAGEIDVDLDLLAGDGLFLLHGDTGAGKTTLLDAISFALFGRVPGARNEAKRLRCDRADPSTRTVVRLEATLGGRRLEITRSPAYLRPKARGAGLTEEKHKVLLRWLDAPAQPVPGGPAPRRPAPVTQTAADLTRAEEVGLAVVDLLGMSADQFFQVVLLPQGDFARFLRSDTAEREVLLEKLFDTVRFGTVEDWFAAARRDSAARLKERREAIGRLTARVAEAAGRADFPDQAAAGWPASAERWLADLRDRLADDSDLSAARAAATRLAAAQAEQQCQLAEGLAGRISRRQQLEERERAVDLAAPIRAAWRRALRAYELAVPVLAAAAEADRQAGRTMAAHQQVEQCRSVAEELVAPDEDVPKSAVDLRAASAAHREEAGTVGALVGQARQHARDLATLADVRRTAAGVVEQIARLDDQLAVLPSVVNGINARLEAAHGAAATLIGLADREQAARATVAAARSVGERRQAVDAATAVAVVAADAHQLAVDRRQQLVERRIAGMAAELAGRLRDGDGCPVCGAAEHPAPAAPAREAVTAVQVLAAERHEREAGVARGQAEAARHQASVELMEATARAGGCTELQAEDQWQRVAEQLAAAAAAAEDADPAEVELRTVTLAWQDATASHARAQARLEALDQDGQRLQQAVDDGRVQVEQARGGFSDVDARRDHLLGLAGALDRLAARTEQLGHAELLQAESADALAAAVAASPFGDLSAVTAAADLDVEQTSQQLRAAEDDALLVQGQLSDPELAGLDLAVEPDLDHARRELAVARAAAEQAATVASAAAARRSQVSAAAANLAHACRELAPVLSADAELAALTDVILGKGQNARAMSLRSFVLAAKLGQVAIAAGQRLNTMSGGRYTFVPCAERESRGRSGGLGLDILDAHSGLVRSAKTLSGGESFLASLALALGLADVVAAEAGGRQLDTMFIDEGFGSLDADTLDMVMGTLDELRAGGRIVGVVSHVDELRQRIPSRLRIRLTPAGSELTMTTS